MVTVKDRIAAMTGCFAAGAMVVGSKAAAIVLAIWAVIMLACVIRQRSDWTRLWADLLAPSVPVALFLAFATLSASSALWAHAPDAALKSGALLGMVIILGCVLRLGLDRLSPHGAMLVAGWFVIGLVGGCLLLFAELYSNFGIFRWAMATFPDIRPPKNSMIVVKGQDVNLIHRAFANWSVAGLNLLTWPSLLILSAAVARRWRVAACLALIAVSLAVTFTSDHETSKIAVGLSAVVFAISLRAGAKTRSAAILTIVALVLSVVPLAQIAYSRLELQNAAWAQFTLKERFKIWGNVSENVWKAPVLGIGANNTTIEHTQKLKPSNRTWPSHHPHNMVLQIWLELGAAGAALLIAAAALSVTGVGRLHPSAISFGFATLAMAAVQSMATWNLWHEWIQSMFMMSFCILMLGNRVVTDQAAGLSAAFSKIWLPERLRHVLSKRSV
ncbi:MAG: O-antigen ligase family protein [Hyphomicrobium sp.]|nr:O-antigen ligase family protein [Hyphomicrobium sp.]